MFILAILLFAGEWIETTQEDFRDGWYTRDLYSSHRGDGAVEFTGRFDFNNDGYIDIAGDSWIMWGSETGFSTSNIRYYGGGGGCDGADLDTDGYTEYINTDIGDDIRIYWGALTGPNADDLTSINTT
ncbi:hypothetical protein GF359_00480 [candidate division WOR-3 bacterium]|uniref:VCBS repeat-containing protein n=1 Tax=candidate division WOR-3 bacterium TaxID=2052148 RepID=A0A9D5K7R9_UNCW3|nr:hypothetical protein [candidate division WOR-3 bacterium]MBD3363669.1 hypothetical protein [candidate division WOR-3 bacterium]